MSWKMAALASTLRGPNCRTSKPRVEAALALAELPRDALPGTQSKDVTITVHSYREGPQVVLELRFRNGDLAASGQTNSDAGT